MTDLTWHEKHAQQQTFGERAADRIAQGMGSWRFIIVQTVVVVAWMSLNGAALIFRWDPYPFILLNLLFSTQAAYSAPIIMMSQNRQSARDKVQAQHQYDVQETELRENTELTRIIAAQTAQISDLTALLKGKADG